MITSPNQKSNHLFILLIISLSIYQLIYNQKLNKNFLLHTNININKTISNNLIYLQGDWNQLLEKYIIWHI